MPWFCLDRWGTEADPEGEGALEWGHISLCVGVGITPLKPELAEVALGLGSKKSPRHATWVPIVWEHVYKLNLPLEVMEFLCIGKTLGVIHGGETAICPAHFSSPWQ